jgi:hypothetical protein
MAKIRTLTVGTTPSSTELPRQRLQQVLLTNDAAAGSIEITVNSQTMTFDLAACQHLSIDFKEPIDMGTAGQITAEKVSGTGVVNVVLAYT